MESINRDRTDLRALFDSPPPRSIGFASGESRVMSISSASLMYISRDITLITFFPLGIYWNFLKLNVNCFERFSRGIFFPIINLAKGDWKDYVLLNIYIGNYLFENYAIRGI